MPTSICGQRAEVSRQKYTREMTMKAWIVKWEGVSDSVTKVDPIVAILNPRRSSKKVAETVEFLYMYATANLSEHMTYASNPSRNPYRAKVDFNGRISCGHHPWLSAERVNEVEVFLDLDTGSETVSYTTEPVYALTDKGPRVISPPQRVIYTRPFTGAISFESAWNQVTNELVSRRGKFRNA